MTESPWQKVVVPLAEIVAEGKVFTVTAVAAEVADPVFADGAYKLPIKLFEILAIPEDIEPICIPETVGAPVE